MLLWYVAHPNLTVLPHSFPTRRSSDLDTERNAVTREFRLLSLGNLPFDERYQRPDYLLSDYNSSQGYLTLRETTGGTGAAAYDARSEEHTSELQSLMRIS